MTAKKKTDTDENADPFGDPDNIQRSFPNRVDQSGTPDTQPDQPAGALGVGQVSSDSVKKESEALQDLADKSSGKKSGLVEVSNEDKAKAAAEVRDGSMIEGGHTDAQQAQLDADLERAKDADAAKKAGDDDSDSTAVPENAQSTTTAKADTKK